MVSLEEEDLTNSHCANDSSTNLVCCVGFRGTLPQYPLCGSSEPHRLVLNTYTDADDYPWTALIQYENLRGELELMCSGTLITKRYIVTAAHCVSNLRGGIKVHRVRLGEWEINSNVDCNQKQCAGPPVDMQIEKITKHRDYNRRNHLHDIALVRFTSDVNFSDTVQPICLPTLDSVVGNKSLITGWLRDSAIGALDGKKMYHPVNINGFEECSPIYEQKSVTLQSTQLCVDMGASWSKCKDHAEGTLMQGNGSAWFLAGVASFGTIACSSDTPVVYTNISAYVDWIRDNIY
ncbi:CLIP domain-containing serine protease B4-like [Anopheles ziemanni]|uniref:CLIP domain-containing serine protease B4-like n=1 Tax=Anopheles coustani TaxID=139045 RepID=UPI00265AEE13|nr:CLIP domain-containing serine protease B4-like [Anopheles coustani]XP_058169083.1 CLIP domain-containing serine protease B4-like [Anopheles ziemanni]